MAITFLTALAIIFVVVYSLVFAFEYLEHLDKRNIFVQIFAYVGIFILAVPVLTPILLAMKIVSFVEFSGLR